MREIRPMVTVEDGEYEHRDETILVAFLGHFD